MEYITLLGLIFLGAIAGWWVRGQVAIVRLKRFSDKVKIIQQQEERYMQEHSLELRMEMYGDYFMFYNKKDDSFVTQARNKDELMDFLNMAHPEKYIFLDPKDIKALEKA